MSKTEAKKPATKINSLKKQAMLLALSKHMGIVTKACNAVEIDRTTHYRWMERDPDYKAAVGELENIALDFGEDCLYKLMKEGNPAAIIFFLKTRGKSRGYVERQEVQLESNNPMGDIAEALLGKKK